jgi:hypothetical protein
VKEPIRLLALTYSPEDNSAMLDWQSKYGSKFKIVACSNFLTVPIQMAVAANLPAYDVDGFLIHDHPTYPEFVLKKLCDQLSKHGLGLYSTHGSHKAIGSPSANRFPSEPEATIHELPLAEITRHSA